MVRCPTCGKEVETPVKEWVADKTLVKQYECCRKKFHEYVEGLGAEEVELNGSARLVQKVERKEKEGARVEWTFALIVERG